jgi:hypothetical protein
MYVYSLRPNLPSILALGTWITKALKRWVYRKQGDRDVLKENVE